MTKHKELAQWVNECAKLCHPDKVVWCDGSEEEKERLEKEAIKSGEIIQLNPKELPGCVYHRTAKNDVARTEHLTYICTPKKRDAGPTGTTRASTQAVNCDQPGRFMILHGNFRRLR